jgi:hypothetical protein
VAAPPTGSSTRCGRNKQVLVFIPDSVTVRAACTHQRARHVAHTDYGALREGREGVAETGCGPPRLRAAVAGSRAANAIVRRAICSRGVFARPSAARDISRLRHGGSIIYTSDHSEICALACRVSASALFPYTLLFRDFTKYSGTIFGRDGRWPRAGSGLYVPGTACSGGCSLRVAGLSSVDRGP